MQLQDAVVYSSDAAFGCLKNAEEGCGKELEAEHEQESPAVDAADELCEDRNQQQEKVRVGYSTTITSILQLSIF